GRHRHHPPEDAGRPVRHRVRCTGAGRKSTGLKAWCSSGDGTTKLINSAAIMIRLQNLTLQRGPQRLLEGAELTLHAGQKVGLIGANGAGKSSLFALLRGELGPDAGDCQLPADWRIAHMRQEVDDLERLAVDYVL